MMQEMLFRGFLWSGMLLANGICEAGTFSSQFIQNPQSYIPNVYSLSAGAAWARAGHTQTIFLTPSIEKRYVTQKPTNALAEGELFVGYSAKINYSDLQAQFGIAVLTAGNATVSGNIWDDGDEQFNNYNYDYSVRHTHVALKAKLFADGGFLFHPWISASLGVGFNESYDFNNTPTIFEAIPNADFGNKTKTAFTYTLGAGLQKYLNSNWQVGLGYEFSDWGKSQLNRASGQTINTGLSLSHIYTNGLLFNVTYVA